jgi:hypothetical protein
MRRAAQANVDVAAAAPSAAALGTIELVNEQGAPTIVLPFSGGDANQVLHAALAHLPARNSSIYGGSVRDQNRRLIARAARRNPAASLAPDHSPPSVLADDVARRCIGSADNGEPIS